MRDAAGGANSLYVGCLAVWPLAGTRRRPAVVGAEECKNNVRGAQTSANLPTDVKVCLFYCVSRAAESAVQVDPTAYVALCQKVALGHVLEPLQGANSCSGQIRQEVVVGCTGGCWTRPRCSSWQVKRYGAEKKVTMGVELLTRFYYVGRGDT